MGVKIKDLPLDERPYEKLIDKGVASLTNEELLAILLKSGTKDISVKELSSIIISNLSNISDLKYIKYTDLLKIKGIGYKKSCVLIAAIELGNRINSYNKSIISTKFNNTEVVFNYYKDKLKDIKQEHFYAVYLDSSKKIIAEKLLFLGTLNYSVVHPREVFKEAYLYSASSIICIHNHPSGNIFPSEEDIKLTNNLISIGKMLGIKVIDHLIIGDNNYYSFFENGDIKL